MAIIRLDPTDNVGTLSKQAGLGENIDGIVTINPVPRGHKIAIADISAGTPIRKYAQIIGYANGDIKTGEHVHTHNVDFQNTHQEYEFGTDLKPVQRCV